MYREREIDREREIYRCVYNMCICIYACMYTHVYYVCNNNNNNNNNDNTNTVIRNDIRINIPKVLWTAAEPRSIIHMLLRIMVLVLLSSHISIT